MTTHRTDTPSISETERSRRQKAVDYARASVRLEGFKLSRADEEHARRFIAGEIGLAEFVKGQKRAKDLSTSVEKL